MPEYKINRKNILGVDIILVEGPQGVGKTSFVASLLSKDYRYHHKERTKQATAFRNRMVCLVLFKSFLPKKEKRIHTPNNA